MDGVDHERPRRITEQQAPDLETRDLPGDDRGRTAWDLVDQARVAVRRAQHHIDVSAQRLNRSQVLLTSCEEQIRSTAEAVEGHQTFVDGARLDHRGS